MKTLYSIAIGLLLPVCACLNLANAAPAHSRVVAKKKTAGGGGGGISYIAGAIGAGNAEDVATVGPINTTGANLLVFVLGIYSDAGTEAITDSKSNAAPTLLTRYGSGNYFIQLAYLVPDPAKVGSNHTFAFDGQASGFYPVLGVFAFSGAHASPFDLEAGAYNANTASQQPGSLTPSQNDCVLVSAACWAAGGTTMGTPSGFSTPQQVKNASGNLYVAMSYKIQTTAGAENPSWAHGGSNNAISATVASFKP